MLTVANYEEEVSSWDNSAQNEIPMTDAEVSQRVLHIRSGWSLQERIDRRHEAERRFAELIEALAGATSAA
jgi:hypothetical protein